MSQRDEFEAWINKPPFEHLCDRNSPGSSWPGQYKRYETELAWQAWQASQEKAKQGEPFKVYTTECIMSGEDEPQSTVWFSVGVQSFRLDFVGNKEETAFMTKMLACALSRIAAPPLADGWVSVPKFPTAAMVDAGVKHDSFDSYTNVRNIYAAMILAAPNGEKP